MGKAAVHVYLASDLSDWNQSVCFPLAEFPDYLGQDRRKQRQQCSPIFEQLIYRETLNSQLQLISSDKFHRNACPAATAIYPTVTYQQATSDQVPPIGPAHTPSSPGNDSEAIYPSHDAGSARRTSRLSYLCAHDVHPPKRKVTSG